MNAYPSRDSRRQNRYESGSGTTTLSVFMREWSVAARYGSLLLGLTVLLVVSLTTGTGLLVVCGGSLCDLLSNQLLWNILLSSLIDSWRTPHVYQASALDSGAYEQTLSGECFSCVSLQMGRYGIRAMLLLWNYLVETFQRATIHCGCVCRPSFAETPLGNSFQRWVVSIS